MNFKGGPFSKGGFHIDLTVMPLYNPFHDGQTQPRAACSASSGFVGPIKAVKNMRQIIGSYALSCIANLNDRSILSTKQSQVDGPAGRRVAYGMIDEVV